MARRSFAESLAMGDDFAEAMASRLLSDRWNVIRLDALPLGVGHGPRLEAGGRNPTLPDLQCTKNGVTVAVEVKLKSSASRGRVTGVMEHGMEQRLLDDYRDYERRQGLATFLIIGEAATGDIYVARVSDLRPRLSHSGGMPPMAYWPRSQMAADWLLRLNRYVEQSQYRRRR